MNLSNDESAPTQEWCWGLPFEGIRPLQMDERVGLEREVKVGRSSFWRWGCGFPLLIWALLGTLLIAVPIVAQKLGAGLMGRNFDVINSVFAGIAAFLIFSPSFGWLRARDLKTWSRDASADLEANSVSIYRAAMEKYRVETDVEAPEATIPDFPAHELHALEVLSASRRILTRNGERVLGHQTALAVEIAQTPPSAGRAAAWTTPLPPTAVRGEGEGLNRRDLCSAEREEIERYARKVWKPFLWPAIGFSSWVGIPLALHFADGTPIAPIAYFFGAIGIWLDWNLARTVLFARRLLRDAEGGIALVVRFSPNSSEPDLPQSAEFLPLSGVGWTVDGQSSAWRHSNF